MQVPTQISFRNMSSSDAIEEKIHQKVQQLERFFDHIIACHVVIEERHHHHRKGNLFHVRVDLTVPDGMLVVSRDNQFDLAHADAYVALRDAFDAAKRQLEAYCGKRRNQVKFHEEMPHGRVREVYPEQDYGRIETADGREIYFHRNSLLNGSFDDLLAGAEVRFVEELGEQGPQAASVRLAARHHIAP